MYGGRRDNKRGKNEVVWICTEEGETTREATMRWFGYVRRKERQQERQE